MNFIPQAYEIFYLITYLIVHWKILMKLQSWETTQWA